MSEAPSPTRKRIVDAATKLFYAEGIGRVSVDAVAEKAGLTKRTLYYHFASKDDLIASVWKGRIVSESTLTSRINAARKAIGDSGNQLGVTPSN